MTGDDYVTVTTILRHVREQSIYVDQAKDSREQVCVPRSLLFGVDDLGIAGAAIGCEIRLRIRRWKADELGLRADRARAKEARLL